MTTWLLASVIERSNFCGGIIIEVKVPHSFRKERKDKDGQTFNYFLLSL